MKMIPVEDVKRFISELEDIFYALHLDDKTWQQFDAITDLHLGSNLREIAQDNITEEIAIVWSIEDVQSVKPDLTDEQASVVLKNLKRNHDASIGINWDLIEIIADDLFPVETSLTA